MRKLILRHTASAVMAAMLFGTCFSAAADTQLVYTALDQPCRLIDTRTEQGGSGPLTAAHGVYTFATAATDPSISLKSDCSLPSGIAAISANLNQLNVTASGNIRAWSSDLGDTGPSAGSAVYNKTVSFNGAYTTVPVGATDGRFKLAVANGQIDITVNVVGYWMPIGIDVTHAARSVAIGYQASANGTDALALGALTHANSSAAVAIGGYAAATGIYSASVGAGSISNGEFAMGFGFNAFALGPYALALGNATASGQASVSIGNATSASGDYSFAMGWLASTSDLPSAGGTPHVSSFIYGDGSTKTYSTADFQFMARAKGGFVFYTSDADQGTAQSTGVYLHSGSGSWSALSDRNAKDGVTPIDSRDVLDRVVAMPLATWHYKAQDTKYRHMGPMAQDFYAAFGLGESDTGIDTIDADGVALAAIQGLNAKLEAASQSLGERDARIAKLETQVAELAETIKHPAGTTAP